MQRCRGCSLTDRPTAPTAGLKKNPLVAVVGEAPGYEEAKQGTPWVGMGGQLMRQCLKHAGIDASDCLFTNVLLCHPPANRDPTADEIKGCWSRLKAELDAAKPKLILALGATAARTLFPRIGRMEDARRVLHTSRLGIPGFITFHPAAALYPGGDTLMPDILKDFAKAGRWLRGEHAPYSDPHTEVVVADDDDLMEQVLDRIRSYDGPIAFDWETTGTSPQRDTVVCLALSWQIGTAVVVPAYMVRRHREDLQKAWQETPARWVAFNGMFDIAFNRRIGLPARLEDDPMLMHYLLDERPQPRSLENLAADYCDAPRYEATMLSRHGVKDKGEMWRLVPEAELFQYAGHDTDYTLRLYHIFKPELEKDDRLQWCYQNLLMPSSRVFSELGQHGFWIDQQRLESVAEEYEGKVNELVNRLQEQGEALLAGLPERPLEFLTKHKTPRPREFNPNSNPMKQVLVWDVLELEEPDIYKREPRSLDKATRDALLERYPDQSFVRDLHGYSETYHLLSRYLRKLPDYMDADGRVRCQWHLDRTETGRLATTDPPLHQWPREGSIRSIFAAAPGNVLLQADYEQIEIRMAAHLAKDAKLTALLKTGADFHSMMASEAFRIPLQQVTAEQRQAAKAVSFGLLYLMGDKKLAENTGLPPEEALAFVQRYKALMPDVWRWIEQRKADVRQRRYVETWAGNRRRFHLITKHNLAALQREAVNMPVQGGASHVTLWALLRLHTRLADYYPEARIVIMVHDSIVVECPQPIANEVAILMHQTMTAPPFETDVPFTVEIQVGQRWGEGDVLDLSAYAAAG